MSGKHIQSIVFPTSKFNKNQAIEFLKKYDLKHNDIDTKDHYIHFRQQQPEKNAKFANYQLKNGVKLVLQYKEPKITIKKADDKKHKYEAIVDNHKIKFGAIGYEDYTTHHDKDRMLRYTHRHEKEKNNWKVTHANLLKPSFWAKNLLWNDQTSDIKKASQIISKSLGQDISLDI